MANRDSGGIANLTGEPSGMYAVTTGGVTYQHGTRTDAEAAREYFRNQETGQ